MKDSQKQPVDRPGDADRMPQVVVGLGASAGGLHALRQLLSHLPDDPGFPLVVVVHLSPEHESQLAQLLQPHCPIPVEQVTETTALEPNRVYVIPPNAHIEAIDACLRLSELDEKPGTRLTIDHFFRTLANVHDGRAIGVVLTGGGSDGAEGIRRIKENGGITIAQDPEEAEYDSMPRAAIASGMVDLTLPLDQIAGEVVRLAGDRSKRIVPDDGVLVEQDEDHLLQKIIARIRARTGHDFSRYKQPTLLRRIGRRMQLKDIESLSVYLDYLDEHNDELKELSNDLLITITEFFRDPSVYDYLAEHVVPGLFRDKGPSDALRVWSVGCSTGEEAYSIAMLLLEEAAGRDQRPQIQVFASDRHDKAMAMARQGVYPQNAVARISPQRRKRFFVREEDFYRIKPVVRETIIFTQHDILSDPPFGNLDLIVCRNLLIYLQRDVQGDVISIFHYALKPDGLLALGTSESIERKELFAREDKDAAVYRKRNVPTSGYRLPASPAETAVSWLNLDGESEAEPPGTRRSHSFRTMHEQAAERYGLPSVLINSELEIVHAAPLAGRYLLVRGGEPTSKLLSLVRKEIRLELRSALHRAVKSGQPQWGQPVQVRFNGESGRVMIRVHPATDPGLTGYSLVIFEELPADLLTEAGDGPNAPGRGDTSPRERELEAELELNRRRLEATMEEYESGREKMQAYNEELQSSNEEVRSTVEDLETGKEELQSMNEELTALSQENRDRLEELSQLSDDLQNLLAATNIATLFLDRQLHIVRFTPEVPKLFNIRNADCGRALTDLTHHLDYPGMQADACAVLDELTPLEREVRSDGGEWYLTRIRPYRTRGDEIAGVVITFIDVTERKRAENELTRSKEYAEAIVRTLPEPLLVLTADLTVQAANAAFLEQFQVGLGNTVGQLVYELGNGQWNIPSLRTLLEDVLPDNQFFYDYEVSHDFEHLGHRVMNINASRLEEMQLVLLGIHDVTQRKAAEEAVREAKENLEHRVAERTEELKRRADQLARLSSEVTLAEHRERQRLGSVLHDHLQQLLVAATYAVDKLKGYEDKDLLEPVERLDALLNESINASRSLTAELSPPVLFEAELAAGLEWLGQWMDQNHGLKVEVHADPAARVEAEDLHVLLFRSVRELLFNVVKHAGVSQASVEAAMVDEDHLRVTVSDNGDGFDPTNMLDVYVRVQGGYGLSSIRERLSLLGGRLEIESSPGNGCRIVLSTPTDPRPLD